MIKQNKSQSNLTGITSAVGSAVADERAHEGIDVTVINPNESDFFGDVEEDAELQQPSVKKAPIKQQQLKQQQQPVVQPEPEEDEEPEEEDVVEEEVVDDDDDTEAATPEAATPAAETIEVEEDEYNHLSQLTPDELIAFGVKHRKGSKTMQSRVDKLQTFLGKEVTTAIIEGNADKTVQRLLHDINDPTFAEYVAGFYSSHQHNGKTWNRVAGGDIDADKLTEYATLINDKQNLDIYEFIAEDEFNFQEAQTRPNSPSGKAMRSFKHKEAEIETKLEQIRQAAVKTQKIDPQVQQKQVEQVLNNFRSNHEDLITEDSYKSFREFIEVSTNNPLEVYYSAWKTRNVNKNNTRKLALREIELVKTNKVKAAQTPQSKAAPSKRVRKADDYFGDIEY
jgi:hypothetical protein